MGKINELRLGERGTLSHNANKCKPPIFDTHATNHIRGKFNASGKFVGYHYRFGGYDRPGVRVTNIRRAKGGLKNLICEGDVQVLKNGEWVNKKSGSSTFWPDGWNMNQIGNEVNGAYIKALSKGFSGSGTITVKGPSGFKVLIQAQDGVIIRTHPVL